MTSIISIISSSTASIFFSVLGTENADVVIGQLGSLRFATAELVSANHDSVWT